MSNTVGRCRSPNIQFKSSHSIASYRKIISHQGQKGSTHKSSHSRRLAGFFRSTMSQIRSKRGPSLTQIFITIPAAVAAAFAAATAAIAAFAAFAVIVAFADDAFVAAFGDTAAIFIAAILAMLVAAIFVRAKFAAAMFKFAAIMFVRVKFVAAIFAAAGTKVVADTFWAVRHCLHLPFCRAWGQICDPWHSLQCPLCRPWTQIWDPPHSLQ